MIERLSLWIKCALSVFAWIPYRLANYEVNKADFDAFISNLTVPKYKSEFFTFIRLFGEKKEYRSVLLWRTKSAWMPYAKERIYFIVTPEKIGPGLVFWHGYNTILFPDYIGENAQIWHNVTVGRKGILSGNPRIGNNVKLCTGAIVIGPVTIGNNCIIGAGAIVTKDIPDNSVVVGNPARIIKTIVN